jgi:hypothetical protein
VDDETRNFIAHHVGAEANIPEAMRPRIGGEDLGSMRRDAAELARQLGIAPPPQESARDSTGRFTGGASAINLAIRRKAGRA